MESFPVTVKWQIDFQAIGDMQQTMYLIMGLIPEHDMAHASTFIRFRFSGT